MNQSVRAGESFTPLATQKLLKFFSNYPIYIYQLPCPEFLFAGKREKKTQDIWENLAGFQGFLSSLAADVQEATERILEDKKLLIIAIARSPCCSAHKIYRGKNLTKGKGLWVLELEKRLKCNIIEFDFKRVNESLERIKEFLDKTG